MDISIILYLLFASGCHLIQYVSSESSLSVAQCKTKKEATFKFTLASQQDATGHWAHKATMGHAKNGGQKAWLSHLEENSEMCGEVEYITTTTIIRAPTQVPKLLPGYENYPGVGSYKYYPEFKNWAEAKKICEGDGAHLVIINSEEELAVILKILKNHGNTWNWLTVGIHDQDKEGQYVTVLGKPFETTGFTRWGSNNPDGGTGSNCVAYYLPTSGFDDIPCTDTRPLICEGRMDQEFWVLN